MPEPTASVTHDRQRKRVYVRMELSEYEYGRLKRALYLNLSEMWRLLLDNEREKSSELDWSRFDGAPSLED